MTMSQALEHLALSVRPLVIANVTRYQQLQRHTNQLSLMPSVSFGALCLRRPLPDAEHKVVIQRIFDLMGALAIDRECDDVSARGAPRVDDPASPEIVFDTGIITCQRAEDSPLPPLRAPGVAQGHRLP